MIFVTVGTELPFDRLVREVDTWAGATAHRGVFAQIGATTFRPQHIPFAQHLAPSDFAGRFADASVIIAHAGMGTILSALRAAKPILVMPRRAALGEHRNDHQLATARRLHEMGRISVAFDERELRAWLGRLDELRSLSTVGPYASAPLLQAIRDFIVAGG